MPTSIIYFNHELAMFTMEITRVDKLPPSFESADFSFEIDSVVAEPFDAIPMHITPVPTRRKAYGMDDALFESRIGNDHALFAACRAECPAGYIAVSRGWNGCAVIDDFAVDRSFRRHGLATALMNEAVRWAAESGLRTIRLETQSDNTSACRFYSRYGFIVGGCDRFLYRDLGPEASEAAALFWYLDVSHHKRLC
jgi:streptothricin acetyltransferase